MKNKHLIVIISMILILFMAFSALAEPLPLPNISLNIGGFESIAEVSLNGRPVGQLWEPDTSIDVTGLLRTKNELVVTVVNVYRNRLIGDLAQFGELKNLRTSSPIRQFLAPDRPLKRTGLFGPITVLRVPVQTVSAFAD